MKKALEKSINLFTTLQDNQTILHSACTLYDIDFWSDKAGSSGAEIVKFILEHYTELGLDLNHRDDMGQTALHHACYYR